LVLKLRNSRKTAYVINIFCAPQFFPISPYPGFLYKQGDNSKSFYINLNTTTMNDGNIVITKNEFLRQFETVFKEELITVEYSQQERKIFLTKLTMPEHLKEEGFLDLFLEELLSQISEGTDRVVPTSPEIAKFIRKNRRKYKDLLPVGINI